MKLLLWAPPGDSERPITRLTSEAEQGWLGRLMDRGGVAHLLRNNIVQGIFFATRILIALARVYRRDVSQDLYHVNWLQNALPLPSDSRPALITVLGSDIVFLKIPMVKKLLRRAMQGRAVAICPNAVWPVEQLRRDFGDLATVEHIPFGIDERWFSLIRRPPEIKPEWLVVTRLTEAKLGDLFAWGKQFFSTGERVLHLVGPMQEHIALPSWVCYHGPATVEALHREWFPRVHGLISLSRHAEGRPQVMLEAMAAGIPIVASAIPAHLDLISNSNCGTLCKNEEAFGAALRYLETMETNHATGLAGRNWVRSNIGTWDDCAERYARIYLKLIESSFANAS